MNDLSRERAESIVGNNGLAAATVVDAARQINHRQRWRLAVFWTHIAEMRRRIDRLSRRIDAALPGVDAGVKQADHRGGRPFTFAAWNGDRAVRQQPQPIGIAKTGGQCFDLLSIGRNSDQSLLARRRVKPALLV